MRSMKSWARLLLLALVLTVVPAGAALAVNDGPPGACTPGYWKNHTDSWTAYSTTQTVDSVLDDELDSYTGPYPYTDVTLLAALQGGGGKGLEGGTKILNRAFTAAVLNAADQPFSYPMNRGDIIDMANEALETGDRSTIIALADYLDGLNNSLPCTLN